MPKESPSLTRNPQYTLSNGATKISIASFYLEQHHNLHPGRQDLVKAWRWMTCWTVAFTWLFALQCQPFQKAWKADIEGMCINSTYVHIFQMSSSMFLDLHMLGMAIAFMVLNRTNYLELSIIVCAGLMSVFPISRHSGSLLTIVQRRRY